jgi:fumarate reductase flavoprotein subunit
MDELRADVVIVGGGLAGHCAALAAAEAGASALILEKQAQVGGSTVLSGGYFAFAGTDMQAAQGIADSGELLYNDLRAVGEERNDPALVRAYAERQLDTYAWLRGHGVAFGALEHAAGQSVPRSHHARPPRVIETLARRASATGRVRTLTGARALRLSRRAEGDRVAAVRVQHDAAEREVLASHGVVIAAGGFARSEELMETFAPRQARALRMGGAANTGDGLRMAWALGAGLRDMGYVKGTFGAHPQAGGDVNLVLLAVYRGAVAVNRHARRFVDESQSYKLLGDACLAQPDGIAFQIFDRTVMAKSTPGAPIFDFAPPLERGLLLQADDLSALAARLGLDPAVLQTTLAAYNRDVDAGCDSAFGRDGLAHHAGALTRIETPPFYGYPSTSTVLATYCGLSVDPATRVLDVFGAPIPGLYAAGEVVGGFHGVAYMTGSSLGKAAVFGRVAGEQAARG